jgi:transposase
MPTVPRRRAAQRERDRLEARRLRAAELFAAGVRQAEVARQLEVSAQAVSVRHARWQAGSTAALYSRGPSGPAPRLSDAQLATVEQTLLEGATANLKAVELANLTGPTLAEVIDQAYQGVERVRRTPHLANSFLRRTGLSLA